MLLRNVIASLFTLAAVGCVSLSDAPSAGDSSSESAALLLDWSSSRIVGLPTGPGGDGVIRTYDQLLRSGIYRAVVRAPVSIVAPPGDVPAGTGTTVVNSGPELDWNIPTDAPVTAPAAIRAVSFTASSNNDALYFATKTASKGITSATGSSVIANYTTAMATQNFYKLKFLYNSKPTVAWYVNLGNVDGSAIALNHDGTKVFVLDASKLHCFATTQSGEPTTATGAAVGLTTSNECSGFPVSPGGSFSWSSPWVDSRADAIYFANTSGKLFRYSSSGAVPSGWTNGISIVTTTGGATNKSSHSGPVAVSNRTAQTETIYVGNDQGDAVRVSDTYAGTTAPTVSRVSLGSGQVWGSAAVDVSQNRAYFVANDAFYEFDTSAATWAIKTTRTIGTSNTATVYASPGLDYANGWVYAALNNKLVKAAYPMTTTSTVYTTSTAYTGADATYPHSSPLPYNGSVFIGTGGGGALEDYSCNTSNVAPALTAVTTGYAGTSGSADTTPLVDFSTGNANFGYGATTGGLVQISMSALTASKQCPSLLTYNSTGGCGGTAGACISGTCADHPTLGYSTVCGVYAENYSSNYTISCPAGTIVGVKFASYGLPSGSCATNDLAINTSCHSDTSASAFLSACSGRSSCSFAANSTTFSSPCDTTQGAKSFAVIAICDNTSTKLCSSAHEQNVYCNGGSCAGSCDPGYGDCNANLYSDGCETSIYTSTSNCGACGTTCSTNHVTAAACTSGSCTSTCASGYADCNNNKQSDGCETAISCSSCCGVACGTGKACIEGKCVTSTTVCSAVQEHQTMSLSCPTGTTISSITYASYGTPTGTCASGFTDGSCNYDARTFLTTNTTYKCVGKQSCSVPAENSVFGDPCSGTFKRLYVQATCTPTTTCP